MASSVYTKTGDAGTTGLYTENVFRNHLYAQKLMVQSMNYKPFYNKTLQPWWRLKGLVFICERRKKERGRYKSTFDETHSCNWTGRKMGKIIQ